MILDREYFGGVKVFRPDYKWDGFEDHAMDRGCFIELWNESNLDFLGVDTVTRFVQCNESHSYQNVVRGLHYQLKHPQGKLLRVLHGKMDDYFVDLRKSSPTFKQAGAATLSYPDIIWIPPGFAHGFRTREMTDIMYFVTDFRVPEDERIVNWTDPAFGFYDPNRPWYMGCDIRISPKDKAAPMLKDAEVYE